MILHIGTCKKPAVRSESLHRADAAGEQGAGAGGAETFHDPEVPNFKRSLKYGTAFKNAQPNTSEQAVNTHYSILLRETTYFALSVIPLDLK